MDFSFNIDGNPLEQDSYCYENAAGNVYGITEAQYFISEVILTHQNGQQVTITADNGAHYIDADIPETLVWQPNDELPTGSYSTISFVFGLSRDKNYQYPNPPENNMSWPTYLGGGYHYMKINGKWQLADGTMSPFNLHAGPGQERDENDNITGFIDNTFVVTLPLANDFVIEKGNIATINLAMNINQWFNNPSLFDFNVIGGSIMENQEAQEILKANGRQGVFSIKAS